MFRGKYHVGNPKERVRAGGVNFQRFRMPFDFKSYVRPFRTANPIPLHLLHWLRPIQIVKILQEAFGVSSNFKNPLAYTFADNPGFASFAETIYNLFVGKAGFARRAPIDWAFGFVSQPLFKKL